MTAFSGSGRVRIAETYAPSAMNPIWPSENTPVNPLVRFSDDGQDDEDREVDDQPLPERLAAGLQYREPDGRRRGSPSRGLPQRRQSLIA